MIKKKVHLSLALISMALSGHVSSADASGDPIVAAPGREVCQVRPVTISDKQVDAKLCVTSGNFSHDKYSVRIGWSRVVEGIDDETTWGIAGTYKGNAVSLTCVPQVKQPGTDQGAAVDAMAKSLQEHGGDKPEQAHDLAIHMLSVETGRLCTFRQGDQALMAIQVDFH
ncbi:hypothetical protein [Luteibacter sp. dw_328]|uniref:hypothetical protein n=1 Tax=Luteibacter sp. dw_328 TaxID=2719796 RepID=UPI001BD3BEA4|nr:hypothetical protein [Luteibacter sp. dw_328]